MTVHADIAQLTRGEAAGIGYLRRGGRTGGQPLVLLHGIGSNSGSLAAMMAALPPEIDAMAWDAPGYLQSRALSQPSPTPRDYAAAAAEWMTALGISRCIMLGHSLGALFAASFAAHFPKQVAAIALLSPALGYRVAPGAALPPAVQSRIDEIETLGPKAFAAKRASRLVGNPEQNPQTVAAVEKAMSAVNPSGYAQAVRALGAGDLLADAENIKSPALVAVGNRDLITPPDNARAAHAALRGATEFHEIPDAGHALPQERPDVVARLIGRFVEEHANV
jgi:pimeloyl-ACP methyl ester carboxylesterase